MMVNDEHWEIVFGSADALDGHYMRRPRFRLP
jgi:hypothetical protein